MNAGELIEQLKEYDPTIEVFTEMHLEGCREGWIGPCHLYYWEDTLQLFIGGCRMNLNQIEFLKALDRNQEYGTLQRILQEANLSDVPFEQVCKHILVAMMDERQTFLK